MRADFKFLWSCNALVHLPCYPTYPQRVLVESEVFWVYRNWPFPRQPLSLRQQWRHLVRKSSTRLSRVGCTSPFGGVLVSPLDMLVSFVIAAIISLAGANSLNRNNTNKIKIRQYITWLRGLCFPSAPSFQYRAAGVFFHHFLSSSVFLHIALIV